MGCFPTFKLKQLNGEACITLQPHFYPTNKLVLDAKLYYSTTNTSNDAF